MNLASLNKILEKFWWAMAIISFIAVTYFCITEGWSNWAFYYVVPVIAVLMALLRRFMSNRLSKSQALKK